MSRYHLPPPFERRTLIEHLTSLSQDNFSQLLKGFSGCWLVNQLVVKVVFISPQVAAISPPHGSNWPTAGGREGLSLLQRGTILQQAAPHLCCCSSHIDGKLREKDTNTRKQTNSAVWTTHISAPARFCTQTQRRLQTQRQKIQFFVKPPKISVLQKKLLKTQSRQIVWICCNEE